MDQRIKIVFFFFKIPRELNNMILIYGNILCNPEKMSKFKIRDSIEMQGSLKKELEIRRGTNHFASLL